MTPTYGPCDFWLRRSSSHTIATSVTPLSPLEEDSDDDFILIQHPNHESSAAQKSRIAPQDVSSRETSSQIPEPKEHEIKAANLAKILHEQGLERPVDILRALNLNADNTGRGVEWKNFKVVMAEVGRLLDERNVQSGSGVEERKVEIEELQAFVVELQAELAAVVEKRQKQEQKEENRKARKNEMDRIERKKRERLAVEKMWKEVDAELKVAYAKRREEAKRAEFRAKAKAKADGDWEKWMREEREKEWEAKRSGHAAVEIGELEKRQKAKVTCVCLIMWSVWIVVAGFWL